MKEYKVVRPKIGPPNWREKFETTLNQYAREGWVLKHISPKWKSLILEREKNR